MATTLPIDLPRSASSPREHMVVTTADIQQFARWSGDCNPLHVDEAAAKRSAFGVPVVHGVLTAIRALGTLSFAGATPMTRLDVQFRAPLLAGRACSVEPARLHAGVVVRAGDASILTIRVDDADGAECAVDTSWVPRDAAGETLLCAMRSAPAALEADQLHAGLEIMGRYRTGEPSAEVAPDGVARAHARVLGLCSYLVGMELPGLRSLFTRLSAVFSGPGTDGGEELWYRAAVTRFDRQFRLLDVRVDVVTAHGQPVAVVDLRSYVRIHPLIVEPAKLRRALSPDTSRLAGAVVLVCGGTRGLGAEVTAALAEAGCHVYASYLHDDAAARALEGTLRDAPGTVESLCGDASSVSWCSTTLAHIQAKHGRLDALVLNACAPPTAARIGPETADGLTEYIAKNLPLAQIPLAVCLPALASASGTVVAVSSSFVTTQPAGFGHYVALKQAVEAMVGAAVRESGQIRGIVARPPKLQTTWNDTPAGVVDSIPASQAAVQIVNRLAAAPDAGEIALLQDFPVTELHEPSNRVLVTLSLVATFTAAPMTDALEFWFKELQIAGGVKLAPYGQVLQTLLDPASATPSGGLQVILLRLCDWIRELPAATRTSPSALRSHFEQTATDFERAVRAAAGERLVVFCPSATGHAGPEDAVIDEVEDALLARLSNAAGVTVIRARDFHDRYGVHENSIADPTRDQIAHIPYQTEYFHVLATIVMRHVHRKLTASRKVIAVDCDNTLWRGVVGEVGPEGVSFDRSHEALHRALVRLSQSGVLVALCSKNEEPDVWRVFETRPDCTLRREHIVAGAINWQPKSENLRALASRLNLGLDSFIYIDDNPVECAEIRSGCPEVLTIEWPQDVERALKVLQHTWELDAPTTTAEDQRRTTLYKQEFQRQELQSQALTFRDFIASLGLVVDIAPLVAEDVKRAAQLTLRTNQFNFTTRRRHETELATLLDAGTHEIRTVRVRDRFGDYGLVGLLIAAPNGDLLQTDTFLLSCRVLGRGVEHEMVAELGRVAQARGVRIVRLTVDKTERNTPAWTFLQSVAPAEAVRCGDHRLEADLPIAFSAALKFEPPDRAVPGESSDERPALANTGGAALLRRREQQIQRTAFELSTTAELTTAIQGRPAASPQPTAPLNSEDVAAFVYDSFARALGLSPARVREIDALDALGCDSFKIVDITVSLIEKFPSLPRTLLFEYRTVSGIAARIAELASPAASPAPAPASISAPTVGTDAVAVVGMHVRCAGAESVEELWSLLSDGRTAVTQVPRSRPYFFGTLDDTRPHFAGLLDHVDEFDAELFGITPREAELMDPQLRVFLQVAWGALEDAGCLGAGTDPDTGVFAGVMYGDYAHRANHIARSSDNPLKCWESFSLANRVSQIFGFHGPSIAVDTACSSSATAIHLACRALAAGDCRVAVAGGVNLILDPARFVQLARLGILSPSGRCAAFGADADGTILGEGAGVVVLRRLGDALDRGDRIYGVIKATGVSTGSGTVGFTAPNPQSQADAIRRTIRLSGVDPRTITYVETHGTGTVLGDPIEVRGLTLAYGDPDLWDPALEGAQVCTLGSIKPNIGHLEAGAGVLGLVKVLLQISRGVLVPSLTSAEPNPQIPFSDTPFDVQRTLARWTPTPLRLDHSEVVLPRRAALNSFGVGGANVHIIVEEPPALAAAPAQNDRPQNILTVSARTEESLQRRLEDLAHAFSSSDDSVADICFSANTGYRHLERRATVVAETREEMVRALKQLSAGGDPVGTSRGVVRRSAARPKLAFLFTGQGSQYPGMGRALYRTAPVFRRTLDECFDLFDSRLEYRLRDVMFADEGSPDAAWLNQTGCTQPALFTIEYALATLWRSWGIEPDVVLGHSIGEIAAMCVAGGVTLEEAVAMVAARGMLMQALPEGGAMVSVMADESRMVQAIAGFEDRVAIGAINGPQHVVLSGEAAAVSDITSRLAGEGTKTRPLVVSHAFHSPLMRPMLTAYASVVSRIRFARPATAFVSTVLGRVAASELTEPDYWLRNVMDPVRFVDGVRALDAWGARAFVETGPQPVLLGMGRGCLQGEDDRLWLPSMRKDAAPWVPALSSLGTLYVNGADVDWRAFDAPYPRKRISLPIYPFARKRLWITGAAGPDPHPAESAAAAARAVTGERGYEIVWKKRLPAAPAAAEGHWLVFADDQGVGESLAARLQQRGATCMVVQASEGNGGEPASVLRAFESTNAVIRGVVYLWGLEARRAAASNAADAATREVDRAASLMRAVSAPRATGTPLLWIVTAGATESGTPAGASLSCAAASLWGLGRTFALEHPGHWGGLIDLPLDATPEIGGQLADEVLSTDGEDQIAVRSEGRYVPRLVARPEMAAGDLLVRGDATYLITGGIGALGTHLARWLVSKGARHIVLTSRRAQASAEGAIALRELRDQGADVRLVQGDVSAPADVDAMFKAIALLPPVRGVFHAAGVDQTRPIQELSSEDVARVLAGKARGAWLLHERTAAMELDWFVCFSSMASVLGSAGRPAYAAANAFLDTLVHMRRREGLPGLSVNWGPWNGGGMATTTALEQYRRIGLRGLEPDEAMRSLEMLLRTGATQGLIADIDWPSLRAAYEARRPRPFLAELPRSAPAADAPPSTSAAAPWATQLAAVSPDVRLGELVMLLRAEVARTLGLSGAAEVAPDQPFRDLGMDSLMSADFAQRLQKQVGIRCASLVFEHPNAQALAEHLVEKLTLAIAPPDSQPPVVVTPVNDSEAANRSTNGSALWTPADEGEVFEFQRRAWPSRRSDWIVPRWEWMFVESARRLNVDPQVWLHRDAGTVVGHNGAIPVRLKVGTSDRDAAWLVDTMVLEAYRSHAVGTRLMLDAHGSLPLGLSLGQTEQMRSIQLRLGWEQVTPLQTAVLLLNPARVLEGKLPRPAAYAAAFGLRASGAARAIGQRRSQLAVRRLDHFGAEHDALWTAMARSVTCAVRRDASYLNWKYVDQPGQEFVRLELMGPDGPRGVLVLMFREADDVYRYRRAFVVDVVAELSDGELLSELLQAARATAAEHGADALWCLHAHPHLTKALRRAGFFFRQPDRFLLIRPPDGDAAVREMLLRPDAWYLTHGDSDIDRPW